MLCRFCDIPRLYQLEEYFYIFILHPAALGMEKLFRLVTRLKCDIDAQTLEEVLILMRQDNGGVRFTAAEFSQSIDRFTDERVRYRAD